MKLDYLRDNKEIVSVVLFGVSVVLGVLVLAKVAGFFVTSARAERVVTDVLAQSKPDPNETEKYFAKSKEIAGELKKKNLFAPSPPKPGQPIKEVDILGDSVLVNGKWYKVGDKVRDAKILAIEPTQIKFEWQGKEITLGPFGAKGSSGSGPRKRGKPDKEGRKETKVESERERGERRARLGRGGRGRFRNLSVEERASLRERMKNMSREERREYMAKMREEGGAR
ncbi:MAG: hypothetical protein ACYSW4_01565 [Planctomycetota bacterium]|jgi:hypothetical protein